MGEGPAPFLPGRRVVQAVGPGIGDPLPQRIDVVVDGEVREDPPDRGGDPLGVTVMPVMLKAFRCLSLAGSASMISTAARSASGMYIMSSRVPSRR